ncbi:hypothetical protein niasHT_008461 [Heterodera trifolii]|uniref:Uncharacterized protein n=1 Tax=Heterodera trifolii TaxID=157864 RepID=A0ABD2M5R6_9BILA
MKKEEEDEQEWEKEEEEKEEEEEEDEEEEEEEEEEEDLIVHVLLITTSVEANSPKKEKSETIENVEANPPSKNELETVTIKAYCKAELTADNLDTEMVPVYKYMKRRIFHCVEHGYVLAEAPQPIKTEGNYYYAFIFKQNPQKMRQKKCENFEQPKDTKLDALLSSVHKEMEEENEKDYKEQTKKLDHYIAIEEMHNESLPGTIVREGVTMIEKVVAGIKEKMKKREGKNEGGKKEEEEKREQRKKEEKKGEDEEEREEEGKKMKKREGKNEGGKKKEEKREQ